jgi:prepilin-type N-terminal cleavage/methylation domain-containing protein
MKTSKTNAFTLIELLVVISIIAILAGIALPAFTTVQIKGRQTAGLSNVKQILLACKIFATDNNGNYPSYTLDTNLQPTSTLITSDANTCFAQLFPDYLTNETIFCEQGSAYTVKLADNVIDTPMAQVHTLTLATGENTFAYCTGLTDTSNALFPMVADGFITGGSQSGWTYSTNKTVKGGVWEGKKAIVGLVDGSASIQKVNPTALSVMGNPAVGTSGTPVSYFSTNVTGTQPWLTGPTNTWLNPL